MGLQLYTGCRENGTELHKCHAENEQIILEYIEELKKYGYTIIDFPPIERFLNYYICNVKIELPNETD